MTAIPAVEKTETAKCSICACNCAKLCTQCGKNFCTKHLIWHAEKCTGYKSIIHKILRDDMTEIVKQVMEAVLKTI
ncbi:MAG: hypothetical protein ACREA1_06805 [Nitrosotalea sp.]